METPASSDSDSLRNFRNIKGNKVPAVSPVWTECALTRPEAVRESFVFACNSYFNGALFKAMHVVESRNRSSLLENLSGSDHCKNRLGGKKLKCNCLHILRENHKLRRRIATIGAQITTMYKMVFMGAPWTSVDITNHLKKIIHFMDMQSETDLQTSSPSRMTTKFTTIGTIVASDGNLIGKENVLRVKQHTVCSSSVMVIFGMKRSVWLDVSAKVNMEKREENRGLLEIMKGSTKKRKRPSESVSNAIGNLGDEMDNEREAMDFTRTTRKQQRMCYDENYLSMLVNGIDQE